MKFLKQIILGLLFLQGGTSQCALNKTESVTFMTSSEESYEFDIDSSDSFLDILENIKRYLYESRSTIKNEDGVQNFTGEEMVSQFPLHLDFTFSQAGMTIRAKTNRRDFSANVSKEEKKDIAYIVKTLGFESIITIGKNRSSLKKAGDRIEHLHPFRFLMTVFNDEELKAGIHAIRDRGGWVWSGFVDGITGSIHEEANRHNLLQFHPDFAEKVKISQELILPSLQNGQWNEFINVLIDKIPRQVDPNRYNM